MEDEQVLDVPADSSPAAVLTGSFWRFADGTILPAISGGAEGEGAEAVAADTPASDTSTETAPSAPGDRLAGQQIPYGRFKEVNDARAQWQRAYEQSQRAYEQSVADNQSLRQSYQQALQSMINRPQTPETMPEGWDPAGNTLFDLMSRHPKFVNLMNLARTAPLLAQGYQQANQTAQQVQMQGHNRYIQDEHVRLGELAKAAGLPSSPDDVQLLSHQVAGVIGSNPELARAYLAGDRQILDQTFNAILKHYDYVRREAQAKVNDVKQRTNNLPPRPAGGAPGQPALPKMDPSNPQAFERAMHQRALDMLRQGAG